ncbi:MAG: hypothetical protein PHS27_00590 [Candidatus Pacebacteria bacterium]|nr:hypothetical protein [Candidatus Paceibacterota bacterium]
MIKFLKTKILLVLSTAIVWFFGSPGVTHALLGLLTKPFEVVIEILMFLIIGGGLSYVALLASQGILTWVASPNFIKVSFTKADNVVVTAGWTVVRDFTNLLFILVLIAIGLMTALRTSKEYQVQKTLPILIGVALLINFTPVICGVIIDASNILMNFFLSAGTEGYGGFINFTNTAKEILVGAFKGLITRWRSLIDGTFLFQVLFFIIFNVVCSFIFLIFALLMIMRHVALWILVIFAPLAFFCYILPGTRKIFRQWWHNFIQWCFVGVGGAFFLYLTQVMLGEIESIAGPARMGSDEKFTILGNLLLRIVPMIMLGAGVFVTMSTSAMGANIVTGGARRLQSRAMGGLKRAGTKWAGDKVGRGARWAGNKIPKGVDKAMGRLAGTRVNWGRDTEGKDLPGLSNWIRRQASNAATGTIQGLGKSGQVVTSRLGTAQDLKAVEKYKKEAGSRTYQQNLNQLQKENNPEALAALVTHFMEKKQIKDVIKSGVLPPDKLEKVYEGFVRGGPDTRKQKEAVERSFGANDKYAPMIARVLSEQDPYKQVRDARGNPVRDDKGDIKYEGRDSNGLADEDKKKGYRTIQEKFIAETRNKEDMDAIVMDPKELAKILGKHGSREQIGWAMSKHGKEFGNALETYMKEAYEKAKASGDENKIFEDVGLGALKYSVSNAGEISAVSSLFNSDRKIADRHRAYSRPASKPVTVGSVNEALHPSQGLQGQLDIEEADKLAEEREGEHSRVKEEAGKKYKELAIANRSRNQLRLERQQIRQELRDLRNAPDFTPTTGLEDRLRSVNEKLQHIDELENEALEAERSLTDSSARLIHAQGQARAAKTGLRISTNPSEATTEDPSVFYKSVGTTPQQIIELAVDPQYGFNFSELTMAIENMGENFRDSFREYIQDTFNQNQAQNNHMSELFRNLNKETMLKFFTTEGRRLNGLSAVIDQQTQTEINLSEDQIDAMEEMYHQANP